jgi:hypothetical protein
MSTLGNVLISGNPQRTDSPEKFSVYCNATEVLISPWDVRINFMENIPPIEGVPVLLVHGSIVMSAIHAKALLKGLEKSISIYEEKFGDLDVQRVEDFQKAMLSESTPQT